MPRLFGQDLGRAELLSYVGDVSQVAGATRLTYSEGPERGVEVIRLRTGTGLDFDVLPGRGMDIVGASYQGVPLAWHSACGSPHSAHYQPQGLGWLRSFPGGLLATCGLLNAGSPGADPAHSVLGSGAPTEDVAVVKLGLHGRVANTAARNVLADGSWCDEDYVLDALGKVREAVVFGEALELERTVEAFLGESTIHISDKVTNLGHDSQPHMMLYHINLGWPVVSPESRLLLSAGGSEARDDVAAPGLRDCLRFEAPRDSYPEQVFYHTMVPNEQGLCHAAIVNPTLRGGFGVGVTYSAENLPEFVQWKSMKRGTYVCGLEPANCRVGGRAAERDAGRLCMLEPGASLEYDVFIEVLDGPQDCDDFAAVAAR